MMRLFAVLCRWLGVDAQLERALQERDAARREVASLRVQLADARAQLGVLADLPMLGDIPVDPKELH